MAGKEIFRTRVKQENDMGKGDYFQNESDEEYCNCQKFKGENYYRDTSIGKDIDKKLFVGNLSYETSRFDLQNHFGKYGQIERVDVKADPITGRSRGFAFIVFKTAASVDRVLTEPDHIIRNNRIDPRRARAKVGKVFVGGVPWDLSDRDIMDYFSQFGRVLEIESPYDSVKQRRMGFCFVTFDCQRPVADVMEVPEHVINGKTVDVKRYERRVREGDLSGRDRDVETENGNYEAQTGPFCSSGVEENRGTGVYSANGAKGRGKASHGKGSRKWQHQESRKMKLRFKVSVELDSE